MECIREGADEFLVKGTLGFQALGRLIRLALERRQRLLALGRTSTGQPNEADATTLESIGLHLLRLADRTGLSVSVLFLKVDSPRPGRRTTPDTVGEITSVLQRTLRRCDLVARLQGDEWAVVLVMRQDDSGRASARLSEALIAAGAGPQIGLGVATYNPHGPNTVDDLIAQARRDLHAVCAS
jgi:PleD family two-component response regulator